MVLRRNRFTEKAWEALEDAEVLLGQYRHSQLDVLHILLSLLGQNGGVTGQILQQIGAPVDELKNRVESALAASPKLDHPVTKPYPTPGYMRLLEYADNESSRMKDEFISVEHLLIAATMVEEEQVAGTRILAAAGVTKDSVYAALQPDPGFPSGSRTRERRASTVRWKSTAWT